MFPQSRAAPRGRTDTPGAGSVLSLERSFYHRGFGTEIAATRKERAPGETPARLRAVV